MKVNVNLISGGSVCRYPSRRVERSLCGLCEKEEINCTVIVIKGTSVDMENSRNVDGSLLPVIRKTVLK